MLNLISTGIDTDREQKCWELHFNSRQGIQLAGAIEYTDCISAKEYPGYDKPSDGEAPAL